MHEKNSGRPNPLRIKNKEQDQEPPATGKCSDREEPHMKTNGYHKLKENASLRKGARGGRTQTPALRLLSATLSLSMLLTGCGPASITPVTVPNGVEQIESALQDGGDYGASERADAIITGFESLPEGIREQVVPLGTTIEDLNLPDKLEAYVTEKDAENGGGG